MSGQTVNVLRYSALAFGVFYGFSHQRTLFAQQRSNEIDRKYKAEEDLIKSARSEYVKRTTGGSSSKGVITDPDDPKFDLEKYFQSIDAGK